MSMTMNRSTEALETAPETDTMVKTGDKRKCYLLFSVFLCIAGIGSLTATAAILRSRSTQCNAQGKLPANCLTWNKKLRTLFEKIKSTSEKACWPNTVVKTTYNFTPELYLCRTKAAQVLLEELKNVEKSVVRDDGGGGINEEERHTLELAKYFLKNTFGVPYEANYYAGDWLMAPNIFCWQSSCSILSNLKDRKLSSAKQVEDMIKEMHVYGESYRQRLRNLKYGVAVGIVPAREACEAGVKTFKYTLNVVAKNGTGIAELIKNSSLLDVDQKEKDRWWKMKNKTMLQSLREDSVKHVGKPLNDLIRYFEDEYISHCPPSNVSSGFATLPLSYVYNDGVPDYSKPTNGSLPGGEEFDGKSAYKILLSFFTTSNITPKEIDDLASQRLREIYPKVLEIAKNQSKEVNETEAIKKFRAILAGDQYFYTIVNETKHDEPHLVCYDAKSAKKYCPQRWKAMNNWRQSARSILSRLSPQVPSAFFLTGKKKITPICPITVEFDYNPSSSYYSYSEGNKDCESLAAVKIPFFLDKLGPKYEQVTVLAHESYPGHHLEVQGVRENFDFKCEKIGNWFSSSNYLAAFSEGWATYVEKQVAVKDMKLYENDIMGKYGMFKHQILAALRAKVDVGVHFMGMKRHEAITLYEKYAWEAGDVIQKEITRLQSSPGQGTAYMVGETKLSELREKAEKTLGNKFHVRDFHYQVLGKGPLPLDFLSTTIDNYLAQQAKTEK